MNTRSRTEATTPIKVAHIVTTPSVTIDGGAGPADTFDLAGAAYRVVLGCCTQEETIQNTDNSRRVPAKAKTSVRKKEVIS